MGNLKYILYGLVGVYLLYSVFFSGGEETTEVEYPTEGLITTVKEVTADRFKIEDEQTAESVEASLIIAKYLDNTIDTFTLDEARLYSEETTGRRSSVARAATAGFFGYMVGKSMSTHRPAAGAYTDPKAHQKASNNAGSRLKQTAARRTVSKPSGRTGAGSGNSTRSYGG